MAPLPHHGVLAKYVNLTTGYRNRYFVLQNGVLVYYKINYDHQVRVRGGDSLRSRPSPPPLTREFPWLGAKQKLSLVEHELVSESYRNLIGEGVKVFDEMGKKCAREGGFGREERIAVPCTLAALQDRDLSQETCLYHRVCRRRAEHTPATTPRPVVQGVMHLQVRTLESCPMCALLRRMCGQCLRASRCNHRAAPWDSDFVSTGRRDGSVSRHCLWASRNGSMRVYHTKPASQSTVSPRRNLRL